MQREDSSVYDYLSYSLAAARRRSHLDVSAKFKKLGIQVEAWMVLLTLKDDPEVTMSDMATIVLLNPPTLTKLVDRMVADGMVERKVSLEDQRKIKLLITDKGLTLLEQGNMIADEHNQSLVGALGHEESKKLHDMLRMLV